MMESCVDSSELHLKKELTALQKARFFRDPETCSSWRSPLNSRSLAATSIHDHEIRNKGTSNGLVSYGCLHELPSKSDDKQNKSYLCNWRSRSRKSNDLDNKEMQIPVGGGPENETSSIQKRKLKAESCREASIKVYNFQSNNLEMPARRNVKKARKRNLSRKWAIRHSGALRMPDIPSSSLPYSSVELLDVHEYSNSEDLQHSADDYTQKVGNLSLSGSPFFSRSGCGSWSCSSRLLHDLRRKESSPSYTPASTSSYNRYDAQNTSTIGSWGGTTGSLHGNDLDHIELPGKQGCGLPCYWSRRTKGMRFLGSPSLSDSIRQRGSSRLCGTQLLHNKKIQSSSHKLKHLSKSSHGVPLLTNGNGLGGSSSETLSDELSIDIEELNLEPFNHPDGMKRSSCRIQEGFELPMHRSAHVDVPDQRSLSQKYKPMYFEDIIGQAMVVRSLRNAISRRRISPAYLFQGPRGTGKTSTARIFGAGLNCHSIKENRPCGLCRKCIESSCGNFQNVIEVEATDRKGLDRIRHFLKNMMGTSLSCYKIFVIDECHLLSSKLWSVLLKYLEDPPPRVSFVFITVEPDNLPRAVVSRCQKYIFPKIKEADIVNRLIKISAEEKIDIESDALDQIALNSDGSLRDAETMLEQLSLLGKKITCSLVNDIIGVVSDDKLLDLLETAMSSDTTETVKMSRELMASGVDPVALMSQLAGIIMDIISGSYQMTCSQSSSAVLGGRSLSEAELERLQKALKILSDAEKQLRFSSERSTWFTAALLQLGGFHNLEPCRSSSTSKKSPNKVHDVDMAKESLLPIKNPHSSLSFQELGRLTSRRSSSCCGPVSDTPPSNENIQSESFPLFTQSFDSAMPAGTQTDGTNNKIECGCSYQLADVWKKCIARCHSKTLRQLLCEHGKLVSITKTKGSLFASVVFDDANVKSRAERFLSSITNSIEMVLGQNVEVRMYLLSENSSIECPKLLDENYCEEESLGKEKNANINGSSNKECEASNEPRPYSDNAGIKLQRLKKNYDITLMPDEGFQVACNPMFSSQTNFDGEIINSTTEEVAMKKVYNDSIDEQRLESAWLQDAEKGTAIVNKSMSDKSISLIQYGVSHKNNSGSAKELSISSKHWEDEPNSKIKAFKIAESQGHHVKQSSESNIHFDISPSMLHSNRLQANCDKDSQEYISGPGCNGLFCWNSQRSYGEKVKRRTRGRLQKTCCLSLFGHCGKLKTPFKCSKK